MLEHFGRQSSFVNCHVRASINRIKQATQPKMSSFGKVLATLGLLCAASQAIQTQIFSKQYFVERADYALVPRKIATADQSFVYMTCNKIQADYEVDCQVMLDMANGTRKQCPHVKLAEPENRVIILTEQVKLSVFAGNKVLLAWLSREDSSSEQMYRKVSLVDMDSCSDRHLEFPLDRVKWPNLQVLVYHMSFDVYVSSRAVCGESHNSQCILRFNSEGERVGEPVDFPSKYANVYSMVVDPLEPKSGGFLAAVEWNTNGSGLMHATHVSHDGSEAVLFSYFMKNEIMLHKVVGSNEHKYFSSCHWDEWEAVEARCMQYDLEGRRMLMDAGVEMEKEHRILNVFNRREGGVLLVYRGCKGSAVCTSALVKMVDRDGHVDRQVELTGVEFQCHSSSKSLSVDHLETESQHCFYFACAHLQQPTGQASYKYFNKCVDK